MNIETDTNKPTENIVPTHNLNANRIIRRKRSSKTNSRVPDKIRLTEESKVIMRRIDAIPSMVHFDWDFTVNKLLNKILETHCREVLDRAKENA